MVLKKFLQNKLWREHMITKAHEAGSMLECKQLDDDAFKKALLEKLLEEVQEVCAAKTDDELAQEIGDVFEVLDCLMGISNISSQEVGLLQESKRRERGTFTKASFVATALHPQGSYLEQYCLRDPHKYPAIE